MLKKLIIILLLAVVGYFFYLDSQTPLSDREWNTDQAVSAEVVMEGEEITIKNVRNFTYRSTSDYTPGYYDTAFNLNDVMTVDYIVEPFGDIGAAHTFLSFGLADGRYLAISVEIRKEVGETFSPWLGLLNQFELTYVIADERDVVNLRANHRKHDVYLYPTVATPEKARELLVSMLKRAQKLEAEPEFYNTITSNCTTNIVTHLNEVTDKDIGYDLRLLLPENSDALAKELGLILPDLSLEEGRAKYKINDRAKDYDEVSDFSKLIREEKSALSEERGEVPSETYPVSRVIDGDTIAVLINGEERLVRYIGLDTPEVAGQNTTDECLGPEATIYNRGLVLGKEVRLESDVSNEDKYGRLLRYVYVDDLQVNTDLVTQGYALARSYPPDTKFADVLNTAQNNAKNAGRGLWSGVCAG
ncbi:MAG: DUF4105 domain-containing protein [Candidatus Paceibacterota bacterium]